MNIMIIGREDLLSISNEIPIEDLKFSDMGSHHVIYARTAHLVLFKEGHNLKVLKSRYLTVGKMIDVRGWTSIGLMSLIYKT